MNLRIASLTVLLFAGCAVPREDHEPIARLKAIGGELSSAPPVPIVAAPSVRWLAQTQWFRFAAVRGAVDLYSSVDLRVWSLEKADCPAFYSVTNTGQRRFWRMVAR